MCDVQNEFKEKSPDLGTIEGNKIKTSSVYYIVGTYVLNRRRSLGYPPHQCPTEPLCNAGKRSARDKVGE